MCLPPVRPVYGLGRAQNAPDRESAGQGHVESGGGGNRTRVLRRLIKASPGAACCSFLSPSVLAGKTLRAQSLFGFPTAPVTGAIGGALYRCQVPERGHIWADSSATVRQRERAGCYRHLSFCREWFSRSRDIRPASLESTSEVETVHPRRRDCWTSSSYDVITPGDTRFIPRRRPSEAPPAPPGGGRRAPTRRRPCPGTPSHQRRAGRGSTAR